MLTQTDFPERDFELNKKVALLLDNCSSSNYRICRMYSDRHITKTCLYNVDPLKPHFYIVKQGFTGVYIIFLIFAKNRDCGTR